MYVSTFSYFTLVKCFAPQWLGVDFYGHIMMCKQEHQCKVSVVLLTFITLSNM